MSPLSRNVHSLLVSSHSSSPLSFSCSLCLPISYPGVLGSPKTCLHAVLSLVQLGPNPHLPIGCHLSQPKLAELCYKLLYCVCINRELSQASLRYLRNNHDYFFTQLAALPFPWALRGEGEEEEGSSDVVLYLNQQSWILRAVALELRMTALKNQRSHVQRLTHLLLSSSPLLDQTHPDFEHSISQSVEWPVPESGYSQFHDGRQKLLVLLDLIQFSDLPSPPLELVYFDQGRVEETIRSCEVREEGEDVPFVSVKVLHRLLMNEVNSLQGAAAVGQKPNILKVCTCVL